MSCHLLALFEFLSFVVSIGMKLLVYCDLKERDDRVDETDLDGLHGKALPDGMLGQIRVFRTGCFWSNI